MVTNWKPITLPDHQASNTARARARWLAKFDRAMSPHLNREGRPHSHAREDARRLRQREGHRAKRHAQWEPARG